MPLEAKRARRASKIVLCVHAPQHKSPRGAVLGGSWGPLGLVLGGLGRPLGSLLADFLCAWAVLTAFWNYFGSKGVSKSNFL